MIVWITGQPGSGKTTTAQALMNHIPNCMLVDGHTIWSMFRIHNNTFANRAANVQHAQNIAAKMADSGYNVIVSMVSPYKNQREEFKKSMGEKLYEVHTFAEDDPVRPKQEQRFEGYEKPETNCLMLNTAVHSTSECVDQILKLIKRA